MKEKAVMCWSGGKDSAFALHEVQRDGKMEILGLLTTVTGVYDRISMHGVRRVLLEEQARSLKLPLHKVILPPRAANADYEKAFAKALEEFKEKGATSVIFGDIFLEDLRLYREKNLAKVGLKARFPLWKRDSRDLARGFISAGFKSVVVCVDLRRLGKDFCGSDFTEDFLDRLPPSVDPCGENGEFHSFVHDGPNFSRAIPFSRGEQVVREEHFCFRDLVP